MLIDKETAYKALKQKEEMYGLSFSAEAFGKAARIVDQMHGADAAKIAKMCNDIEDVVSDIAFNSTHSHIYACCQSIRDKLEEIRKELTVNVPKPD